MKKTNKKGFTLAELLVVVAIIAVLVAIAIPIFTSQLEKSREATDMANIRSAYAEVSSAILSDTKKNSEDGVVKYNDGTYSATVTATQSDKTAWVSGDPKIGGQQVTCGTSWTISGKEADGKVTITTTASK